MSYPGACGNPGMVSESIDRQLLMFRLQRGVARLHALGRKTNDAGIENP